MNDVYEASCKIYQSLNVCGSSGGVSIDTRTFWIVGFQHKKDIRNISVELINSLTPIKDLFRVFR